MKAERDKLPPAERPTHKIRYSVRQNAPWRDFPLDMLRHDGSLFAAETEANSASRTFDHEPDVGPGQLVPVTIDLIKYGHAQWEPNYRRWESFGWEVV